MTISLLEKSRALERWDKTNQLLERLCEAVERLVVPTPEEDDRAPEFAIDPEPDSALTEQELRELQENP